MNIPPFDQRDQPTRMPIDALPFEVQSDIAFNLAERHPFFTDNGFGGDAARDNLIGLIVPPEVVVGRASVRQLLTTTSRATSAAVVARYAAMLRNAPEFEFDPILVANGSFYDGGHRLAAYSAADRESIPTVECGHIVLAESDLWQRWVDGDPDAKFEIAKGRDTMTL
jgi:hypothetical protein